MATTAAIHNQATDQAIYVATSGDPANVEANIKRIIAAGKLDELFSHGDYYTLNINTNAIRKFVVDGVGELLEEQGNRMTVSYDPRTHAPFFSDGDKLVQVNHKYAITPAGELVTYHRH